MPALLAKSATIKTLGYETREIPNAEFFFSGLVLYLRLLRADTTWLSQLYTVSCNVCQTSDFSSKSSAFFRKLQNKFSSTRSLLCKYCRILNIQNPLISSLDLQRLENRTALIPKIPINPNRGWKPPSAAPIPSHRRLFTEQSMINDRAPIEAPAEEEDGKLEGRWKRRDRKED